MHHWAEDFGTTEVSQISPSAARMISCNFQDLLSFLPSTFIIAGNIFRLAAHSCKETKSSLVIHFFNKIWQDNTRTQLTSDLLFTPRIKTGYRPVRGPLSRFFCVVDQLCGTPSLIVRTCSLINFSAWKLTFAMWLILHSSQQFHPSVDHFDV